ncbi:MAG: xanthine dehydrogenase molybdopterin binding subunit, partial [Candidatus Puniceispirillaceae bacterium]
MTKAAFPKFEMHDSAVLYVTGQAEYSDDKALPENCLSIALGLSEVAHGKIQSVDLSDVIASEGVVTVITAKDIPGANDASPVMGDDPVFATDIVSYHGQSLFAVAATSARLARMAAQKAKVEIEALPAILSIDEALEAGSLLAPPKIIETGEAPYALETAPHCIQGTFRCGGQEHFYLEGQAAIAIMQEDSGIEVFASTQHPTEIQHKVAEALALPYHDVTVTVRRMGGAFGGKESQANLPAIIAALVAHKTGQPAKLVYDRDEDMKVTGKRHDAQIDYEVGFDDKGRIKAMTITQSLRCGMSYDLSAAIAARAMMHAENCYYIEHVKITSQMCRTNTPSNTAFRGFGGPQGMAAMEHIIEKIAHFLSKDPYFIRQANYYADKDSPQAGQLTPYGQPVRDCLITALTSQLAESSDYLKRRDEIATFNKTSHFLKRGIALTPVKFGISFNKTILNQAGALVHVYTDGSVHLNHGGTEMGQGLFTKVRQICAHGFGIEAKNVKVTATSTGKVPNTSATAASSGTDLNGMATANAVHIIKDRMAHYLASTHNLSKDQIRFEDGQVMLHDHAITFAEAALLCWQGRISLSSTGYYATPDIFWDEETGKGSPFYYFAYGAAVSEVMVDILTGESRIMRVDILHDAGHSLNPAIDKGQIEGGFVQGAGWLTTEEVVYGQDGKLLTHAPSTYKIPACSDRPRQITISLY